MFVLIIISLAATKFFSLLFLCAYSCKWLFGYIFKDEYLMPLSLWFQPSVRKQHNAGYKHKVVLYENFSHALVFSIFSCWANWFFILIQANVRTYYQQFEEQQTQSLIDQRIKEHLGNAGAFPHQVGATFNQHLMSLQSNPQRPRLPVMPPPLLHPGGQPPLNQGLLPGVRPPVLPRPLIPGRFEFFCSAVLFWKMIF